MAKSIKTGKQRKTTRKAKTLASEGRVAEANDLLLSTKGQSTTVLDTEHDLSLVGKAVRQRWPVLDIHRPRVVNRLVELIEKRTTTITIGKKQVEVESPVIDANSIAAARVLVAMEGQNQLDDHEDKPKPHELNPLTADVRRVKLAELRARLGHGGDGELVIDAASRPSTNGNGSTH